MSLIKCPECKKEMSNKASVCPNCGFPIKKEASINKIKNTPKYVLSKTQSGSKIILEKIKSLFSKIMDNKPLFFIGASLLFLLAFCLFVCVVLFGMWLFSLLMEWNAIVSLILLVLGGNILSWFASYKWGAAKWFFPLGLFVSICFLVVLADLFS